MIPEELKQCNNAQKAYEPFILIYDWMHQNLKLKGSELLVFALIYSFCCKEIADNHYKNCTASQEYIGNRIGLARQNVSKTLRKLEDKGLIRIQKYKYGKYYSVNFDEVKIQRKEYLTTRCNAKQCYKSLH